MDLQARMGKEMKRQAMLLAEERGCDRSEWADAILWNATVSGLRKADPAALIAGLTRDDRVVLRVSEETSEAVRQAAADAGIPIATFIILAFAGELSR